MEAMEWRRRAENLSRCDARLGYSVDCREMPVTTVECPVCGAASTLSAHFPREQVVEQLQSALMADGLDRVPFEDASLRQCEACGLEYSDPMQEPGAEFYQWLTQAGFNYPQSRWEWLACRQLLTDLYRQKADVLRTIIDVGCGDGRFLELLSSLQGLRRIGLDLNPDVVALCRGKGLDVIQGDLAAASSEMPEGIDAISLWHVVEHVGDPVGVLTRAKALLRKEGMIFFSVPLTPMSYERSWPDPFNAPPHHLTRWCPSALQALAARLDMKMQLVLPDAESYPRRVLRGLTLQAMPPFGVQGRSRKLLRLIGFLARRPWRLLRECWWQARLPKINGRTRPDVVLVYLRD